MVYLGESRIRRAEDLANPVAAASYYRAAVEPFERAAALAPNDETFLVALGRVYDALGRFPEAERRFGQAREWDPRSGAVQQSYAAHLELWSRGAPSTEPVPTLDLPAKNAPWPAASVAPTLGQF